MFRQLLSRVLPVRLQPLLAARCIKVTLEDINQARGCKQCPLKTAMERTFGKPVVVSGGYWYFEDRVDEIFLLPRGVTRILNAFDLGRKIKPFAFVAIPLKA
ncbi:MAG TPA: hypothetical protein VF974_02630 [Patescibacteria group bacterium]